MRIFETTHGQVLPKEYYKSDFSLPIGNIPLTALGKEQAKLLAKRLKDFNFQGVIFFVGGFLRGLGSKASPNTNLRPRQRSAANADGRDCRGAKAGQHDAAVSVPRTLSRGALHRNQRHFWYFWCQKYICGQTSFAIQFTDCCLWFRKQKQLLLL